MSKILIVDDNEGDLELLVTLLQLKGHVVLEARHAEEALDHLSANRPDLIITDICMPGTNGLEMVNRILEDPAIAAIPLIFYTALYDNPDTRESMRAYGCPILAKPVSIKEILSKIEEVLRRRSGAAET